MNSLFLTVLLLCIPIVSLADGPENVRTESRLFGAAFDAQCEEGPSTNESAFAGWALKFAINSLVGFSSSFLDKVTEPQTVVRSAIAAGHFYTWDPLRRSWTPSSGCIRFWYGDRTNAETRPDYTRFGAGPSDQSSEWKTIIGRWAKLGFIRQPYLYGEVRFQYNSFDNTVILQPVVLFARRPPEGRGFFSTVTRLAVAIDVRPLTQDKVVATHVIEFPEVNEGAILVRGYSSVVGLGSGWSSLPGPPSESAKPRERSGSPFNALVTFTSTSDGTLFGKTIASTLKAQKDELIAAITPASKQERDAKQEKATSDAFDAVAAVLEAEKALASASEVDKPVRENAVAKAKYLANARLVAAGLSPKYSVPSP